MVVSLNTDEFIYRYKGEYPAINYEDRKEVFRIKYVDEVIPNIQGEDSKPTILSVNPKFIVIGTDWAKKDYYKQMNFTQKWLDDNGFILIYIPYTENVSSTIIKKNLKVNSKF